MEDIKETIQAQQKRDPEERFSDVAKRLELVFGRAVSVSRTRDFNGVPDFVISAGKDKDQAEAIIRKLTTAITNSGLTKEELPFSSDSSGNIRIYGGKILNYAQTGPDVITKIFDILENSANSENFSSCFPKKEREVPHEEKLEALTKQFSAIFPQTKVTTASVKGTSMILIKVPTSEEDNIRNIVNNLIDTRISIGLTKDDLPLYDNIRGYVAIEATPLLDYQL